MESNNELKEIDIKKRTSYHFDDIIKIEDFHFDDILIDEKSYENILVYKISYKTLIGAKLLRIRFNIVDRFVRVYDKTRYLVLFDPEKYDIIYNRIRYLINQKTGITYVISHNYAKVKADSFDSLPLEKTLTFNNVKILIELVFNKDKNSYYYKTFFKHQESVKFFIIGLF